MVTIFTTRFNIIRSSRTLRFCVLCGSQNKRLLFPYTLCGQNAWVFFNPLKNKKKIIFNPSKAQWSLYLPPGLTSYVLPAQCVFVFCVDLRTNGYYFPSHCVGKMRDFSLILLRIKNNIILNPSKAQWSLYLPPGLTYILPAQRVFVFCVDLRTNGDYFSIRH